MRCQIRSQSQCWLESCKSIQRSPIHQSLEALTMASLLALGATIISLPCPNCGGSMLVHDGTVAEITCQLCSRSWECAPDDPGHEDCIHFSSVCPLPPFPRSRESSSLTSG